MKLPKTISVKFLEKVIFYAAVVLLLAFLFICFEFYIPINPNSHETVIFTVQKGWSNDQIALNLKKLGLVKSSYFFKLYAILSFKHVQLQAGDYSLSPRMSIHEIANQMTLGNVIKNEIVIPEGWDIDDIAKYLELKEICKQDYFISLVKKDYSQEFIFLGDKPKELPLEGYLFPDTYQIAKNAKCEDVVDLMLSNFDSKFTFDLRNEIKNQNKSIFDIITMASIIEKEGRGLEEKKIISGIFWKRIAAGIPLQSCATVNYVTGKCDPGVSLKDLQIDSPYNTYKYRGLPKGPISNPGMDSISAAIYPTETDYWYFLSDGKTIFSKTLEEHNAAKAKYLQ